MEWRQWLTEPVLFSVVVVERIVGVRPNCRHDSAGWQLSSTYTRLLVIGVDRVHRLVKKSPVQPGYFTQRTAEGFRKHPQSK